MVTPGAAAASAKPKKKKEKDENEHGPPPPGNGGKTEKYVWTQTLKEVTVFLDMPSTMRSKMLYIVCLANSVLPLSLVWC